MFKVPSDDEQLRVSVPWLERLGYIVRSAVEQQFSMNDFSRLGRPDLIEMTQYHTRVILRL